jgi:hypothetical protein
VVNQVEEQAPAALTPELGEIPAAPEGEIRLYR